MFTGIVLGTGKIKSIRRSGRAASYVIDGKSVGSKLRTGGSVAVNGVCLTVVKKRGRVFEVQAVEETLRKTNLGLLEPDDHVNLELPLCASDRLAGHLVLGHIDGVGEVASIKRLKKSWMFRITVPKRFSRYLIPTGSIAVDGVSLTVARLEDSSIGIAIIPHTMEVTRFKYLKPGDRVNLEFDVLGKYVERFLSSRNMRNKIRR